MRICLYEDRRVADLAPLALARPVADLLCGMSALEIKHRRYFAPDAVGHLVRPIVAELTRAARPYIPVNNPQWLRAGPTVLVNARWVPPPRAPGESAPLTADLFADGPFVAVCDGDLAFAAVGPDALAAVSPATLEQCLEDWLATLPVRTVGGTVLRKPADLVACNKSQIAADFPHAVDSDGLGSRPAAGGLTGPADRLFLHPTAAIDPMVMIDTTGGPVAVAAGAVVAAFTRLDGPCFIGPGAHVLGATIRAGTSIGAHCRIGGEVAASIFQGYADKAHQGFMAYSYVGEWATLGPGTQTVAGPDDLPTGCFIGDHARIAPGTLFDRETCVGLFATVLPLGGVPPRDVPSFSRVGPDGTTDDFDCGPLFAAAAAAMTARGRIFTRGQESVYRAIAAQASGRSRPPARGSESVRFRIAG
ncbi:putative sugar nucleotidyl transferase [Fimbriiglobus ruber]|uniref:Glucose-1-phosphate thymidylyltransferase n=1 Tax=Fimbriiglobus ruber TaxID=1908690 RepID=A0A225DY75_9BACT|nr:putative sugar nucleotidyl transferase [Fimbriiglobus ruber]OWK41077.1 Glucose-1-phosphate thymidylyltransferase [Fimbriiglobus ruber]